MLNIFHCVFIKHDFQGDTFTTVSRLMSSLPWDFLLWFFGTPVCRKYSHYLRALCDVPRWHRVLLYIRVTYCVGGGRLTLHTGVRFNPRSGQLGFIVDEVERGNIRFSFRVVVSHYSNITIPPFISVFDQCDRSITQDVTLCQHYTLLVHHRGCYNSPIYSRSNKGFRHITPRNKRMAATLLVWDSRS